MSEHTVDVTWDRGGRDFGIKSYSRNHLWRFANGTEVSGSAAPGYLGDPACVDPEAAFCAALSSCHMLTFLALCAKDGLVLDRYADHAVAFLERNAERKTAITRIELHPVTTFAPGITVPAERLADLHAKAHEYCFIANSIKTEVRTVL